MFNSGELLGIIGMGVFLLLAMMIGGFVLLHPLARRLGHGPVAEDPPLRDSR